MVDIDKQSLRHFLDKTGERPERFETKYGVEQSVYSLLNLQAQRNVMKNLDSMHRNEQNMLLNRFNKDKNRAPFKPGESHLSKFTADLHTKHGDSIERSIGVASEGGKSEFNGGLNPFSTLHISSYENVPTQASLHKKVSGSIVGSSALG